MLVSVNHILPRAIIRRPRLLPVAGKVLVRKGQKVLASDVVAEANLHPEHMLLDIARGLNLSVEKAELHIQRKEGELISAGDLIAGPVGLPRRTMRAPKSGQVVMIRNGQVLIEVENKGLELRAGLPGVVTSLMPDRGVIIETTGALVQGVWGNGKIDSGLLHMLAERPMDLLTSDRMDVGLRGGIAVGGHCANLEALQAAAGLPVRGLILASLDSALVEAVEQLPFPVILLEGFGPLPMNSQAFQLLAAASRAEAALNAEPLDRLAGKRPEIVIPLQSGEQPVEPQESSELAEGRMVRLVRQPLRSATGILVGVMERAYLFPSGLRAPAAEVRLENGEQVIVPQVNLELID